MLIVLAVLSRAVIPAGMMPDFQAQSQGIFKLTICSGDGMKTIDVPTDHYNPTENPQQKHNNQPCSYAAGLNLAHLILAVLILLLMEIIRVLFIGLPPIRLSSKPLFVIGYPRAPPCFS